MSLGMTAASLFWCAFALDKMRADKEHRRPGNLFAGTVVILAKRAPRVSDE